MKKFAHISFILAILVCFSFGKASASGLYITKEDVVLAIIEEFANNGIEEELEIELFGGQTSFSFDEGKSYQLLISSLIYDDISLKFSCDLDVFVDEKHENKSQIQGRFFKLLNVYIPAQNINRDEVISDDMLKTISMRQSKIKAGFEIEKDKIVGMQAKKVLREGRLISIRDIGKETIIKKGDLVNMKYNTKVMQIVAQGQALFDAAKGDKIELLNVKSKKIVTGIVVDKDNVEIGQ